MSAREITISEKTIRLSLETIQRTIEDLCRQRDALAAMLPNAPKSKPMTHYNGYEIKQGGRRKQA